MKTKIKLLAGVLFIFGAMLIYDNLKAASTYTGIVNNPDELKQCTFKQFDEVTCQLSETFPDLSSSIILKIDNSVYASKLKVVGKKDSANNLLPLAMLDDGLPYGGLIPHFEVSMTQSKTALTFSQLYLKGSVTNDVNGYPAFNPSQSMDYYNKGGINFYSIPANTTVNVEDSIFSNIKSSALFISKSPGASFSVNNTLFSNNINNDAAALSIDTSIKNLSITNSEFVNNIGNLNTSFGKDGGAIKIENGTDNITISNNLFKNNATQGLATSNHIDNQGAGGAIAFLNTANGVELRNANYLIKQNYFVSNEANRNPATFASVGNSHGGAISFKGANGSINKITIEENTFDKSTAHNYGGSLYFRNISGNVVNIWNNTFFQTKITAKDRLYSGASVYFNGGNIAANVESNTFQGTRYSTDSIEVDLGRRKYFDVYTDVTRPSTIINNISADNRDKPTDIEYMTNQSLYEYAFFIKNSVAKQHSNKEVTYSAGVDSLYNKNMDYFGLEIPILKDNGGYKAGLNNNASIIPTLRIVAFSLEKEVGVPIVTAVFMKRDSLQSTVKKDQRGFLRGAIKSDIGAFETTRVKYILESNSDYSIGWEIPYYPNNYVEYFKEPEVADTLITYGDPYSMMPVLDGSLIRSNRYILLGWSLKPNQTTPDFYIGDSVYLEKELNLYPVFITNNNLIIEYLGNGNTSGEVPIDNNSYIGGTTLLIKNGSNLNKNGMIFTQWNTKADGSGLNYNSNSAFVITQNTKLYAQYQTVDKIYNNLNIAQRNNISPSNVSAMEGYAMLETKEFKPAILYNDNVTALNTTPKLDYLNFGEKGLNTITLSLINETSSDQVYDFYVQNSHLNGFTRLACTAFKNATTPCTIDISSSLNGLAFEEMTYIKLIDLLRKGEIRINIKKEIVKSQIKVVATKEESLDYTDIKIHKNIYEYKITPITPMYYKHSGFKESIDSNLNYGSPIITSNTFINKATNYVSIIYNQNKTDEEQYYSWSNDITEIK